MNNLDGLYNSSILIEVQSFLTYSSCSYTMTATATVEVASLIYEATITYTMLEPSQDVQATFDFPEVDLESLSSGELLTFVPIPCVTGHGFVLKVVPSRNWHCPKSAAPNDHSWALHVNILCRDTINHSATMAGQPSGCIGYSCNGFLSLESVCSVAYGADLNQPYQYLSCMCQNATAYRQDILSCYNCYSSLGNVDLASTLSEIYDDCRSLALLTSTAGSTVTGGTSTATPTATSKSMANAMEAKMWIIGSTFGILCAILC